LGAGNENDVTVSKLFQAGNENEVTITIFKLVVNGNDLTVTSGGNDAHLWLWRYTTVPKCPMTWMSSEVYLSSRYKISIDSPL
jgi:hypothetical protein